MKRLIAALVALAAVTIAPAQADADPSRLYLLASDSEALYWSPDRLDPELGVRSMTRLCRPARTSVGFDRHYCLAGVDAATQQLTFNLGFHPAAVLDAPITWSPSSPLTFRMPLQVDSPAAYSVHFIIVVGGGFPIESPPATEVAPGIWEGKITAPGTLEPGTFIQMGPRIRTRAPQVMITLGLGGDSYLQLPEPAAVRGIPALMASDIYAPKVTSLQTAHRSFAFNDDGWSLQSFDGDLRQTRSFPITTEGGATLIAWTEGGNPPLYDAYTGRTPDHTQFTDRTFVRLFRGSKELEHAMANIALTPAAAGDYVLTVEAFNSYAGTPIAQGSAYKLHVLTIHGERTLRSMRARIVGPLPGGTLPALGFCQMTDLRVPQTPPVRSILVDADWEATGLLTQKWTIAYSIPTAGAAPCGGAARGDKVRFTFPGERNWQFGVAPSSDHFFMSAWDSLIELTIRYTYDGAM